jgi:hypothetical protein
MRWTAWGGGVGKIRAETLQNLSNLSYLDQTQESNLKHINFEACKRIRASGYSEINFSACQGLFVFSGCAVPGLIG